MPEAFASHREAIEIRLLVEALHGYHGLDFRDYSPRSLRRRVWDCVRQEGLTTISGLQERVLHEPGCIDRVVKGLTVKVTSMFRDPTFYRTFRRDVVPLLRTYPFLRIWHAGCSTGEEVYAMAILLSEEGLYPRCRIYATDLDEGVLREAAAARFSLASMPENGRNYLQAGSRAAFSDYYTVRGEQAVLDASLRRNLIFARHDLATDSSFNEFHVIFCRNVMLYFQRRLQERVHLLLYDSLGLFGYLGLGSQETVDFTPHQSDYEAVCPGERIYRKVR